MARVAAPSPVAAEKRAPALVLITKSERTASLIRWRKKTDTARRTRAWCAPRKRGRARRFDANLSLWVSSTSRAFSRARPSAEARRGRAARPARHGFFPLAQARVHGRRGRRARAAGVREVAVRKDGARVRRLSFFGVREAREAFGVDGVLRDEGVGEGGARWRERVVQLEHHRFGDAVAAMRSAVNKTRLTKRIDAWRLAVFRGRERDREAAEAHRAREPWPRLLSGLGRRYRVGDFLTDQLLAETERLELARPRARARAFVLARARDATRRTARASRRRLSFWGGPRRRLSKIQNEERSIIATRFCSRCTKQKSRDAFKRGWRHKKNSASPRREDSRSATPVGARFATRCVRGGARAPAEKAETDARGTESSSRARLRRRPAPKRKTKTSASVEARWRRKKR